MLFPSILKQAHFGVSRLDSARKTRYSVDSSRAHEADRAAHCYFDYGHDDDDHSAADAAEVLARAISV
jgi:hypothetical protein